jgi:hypothetical protein
MTHTVRDARVVNARSAVNVDITVFDAATMRVLDRQSAHNLVVTNGLNLLRDAIDTGTITPLSRFAVGTSATAVNAAQTALITEVWRDAFTTKTTSAATVSIRYFLTSLTANGNTLREAGLFNAAAAGDMYARVVFNNEIVKTSAIAVLFAWTLTWSAA